MTTQPPAAMSDKDKVLAKYPDAEVCRSEHGLVYIEVVHVISHGNTEAEAWASAALNIEGRRS